MNWEGFLSLTHPGRDYLELVCACMLSHFSCVRLFVTLRTIGHQAPMSMGFSRQEYWSRLPFSSPGNPVNPGIEPTSPVSPALQVDSLPLHHWGSMTITMIKSP